ncbi:MAG TPA: hypothetical protein DIV86_06880 [Alphaproteobacteria bacterium]|nr:hypothetical protein [Alphaproteobacteria bacterium]
MILTSKNIFNNYMPITVSMVVHGLIIFATIFFVNNATHNKNITQISLIHLPQIENFVEKKTQQKPLQNTEIEAKVTKQILTVKKSALQNVNKENKAPENSAENKSSVQNNNSVKNTRSAPFILANNLNYLYNPAPQYPASAKRRSMEGKALLAIEILKNGNVSRVKIQKSSGFEILDKSALDAVKKWRFKKSKRKINALIPIEFKMVR